MGKQRFQALRAVAVTLLAAIASPISSANTSSLYALSSTIKEVYQTNHDAIVRVKAATQSTDQSGSPQTSLLVFSGFFISPDGQVLTNAIPTNGSSRVWVEIGGLSYLADVIGSDERSNTALLQLVNLPARFAFVNISEEVPDFAIGDFAFSVTSPLDFAPTPKFGLVTGFESHFAEIVFPFTYTRLGIPIGPAEGGSPVFNADGQLVGIAIATLPEVGSSYIVPAKALRRIIDELTNHRKVRYGLLPIEFEEKGDSYNLEKEIAVKSIVAGSPASRAGLQKGDVLLSADSQSIDSLNQLRDLVFYKTPGEFLLLNVKRDNKTLEFAILLEPIEDHQSVASSPPAVDE